MKVIQLKQTIRKEFFIYLATLLVLIVIAHSDILTDPVARFKLMGEKENYTHPLLYSFVIYAVIFVLRKTIDFVVGLFEKKTH